jgi:hypothetical protein
MTTRVKPAVPMISVVAGIRNSLGNHPPVQRWVNPHAINQIITTPYGLSVALTHGGGLDIFGKVESELFLGKLGIMASVTITEGGH